MLYSVFNDHAFSGVTTVAVVQWAQVDSNHRPHKHEVFSYQARAVYVRASYGIEAMPIWWAQVDSNHRPRAYQARALTA